MKQTYSLVIILTIITVLFCLPGLVSPVYYEFTTIDYPGSASNMALGINNAGQIVGLNNDGQIAGDIPGRPSGLITSSFLRETDGSVSVIDAHGSNNIFALGSNSVGQIVGSFQDKLYGVNLSRYMLDRDGKFSVINYISYPYVHDINDLGQKVRACDSQIGIRGFLGIPTTEPPEPPRSVPEPSSVLLLGAGLAGLGLLRRRFKN